MSLWAEAESDRVCGKAIAPDFGAVFAMCLDLGAWEANGPGLPGEATGDGLAVSRERAARLGGDGPTLGS